MQNMFTVHFLVINFLHRYKLSNTVIVCRGLLYQPTKKTNIRHCKFTINVKQYGRYKVSNNVNMADGLARSLIRNTGPPTISYLDLVGGAGEQDKAGRSIDNCSELKTKEKNSGIEVNFESGDELELSGSKVRTKSCFECSSVNELKESQNMDDFKNCTSDKAHGACDVSIDEVNKSVYLGPQTIDIDFSTDSNTYYCGPQCEETVEETISTAENESRVLDRRKVNENKKTVLPENLLDKVTTVISDNPALLKTGENDMQIGNLASDSDSMYNLCGLFDESKHKVTKSKPKGKRKRKDSYEEDDGETASKKSRPNYFLAVQITNPQIHKAMEVVQQHIISQEEALKPARIPLPTLHLTLMVMHLASDDDIARARGALDACKEKLESLTTQPIVLTSCGIDNFGNQVVFAKLEKNKAAGDLNKIAEFASAVFKDHGFNSGDDKGFKPHITILKLSKLGKKHKKKGTKKMSPDLYSKYCDCVFGAQTVRSVQLCAMLKPKDEFGYYHVEHQVDIGDYKEVDIDMCEISGSNEKHICTPKPKPGKRFRNEFEKELTWTFFIKPKICDEK